ncbi:MAG: bi-domain-containing oxidoreductase [Anaerolineae bacterium]|nr:bi-domain-containing oxidoreductase [Anaerolineae bacterium]
MKQVFFDGKGKLLVEDVPAPAVPPGGALVEVAYSLISSGTETTQATGGGSLIGKALAQPELIGRAVQLALREGLSFTARAVQDISATWFPAGYSSAGTIRAVGPGLEEGFQAGDRVACSGAGAANHAHYNAVPANLMARIPEGVSERDAAFTTLGAIALQGVRRAEVTLGETVVVIGLGLIGQLTAQILAAAGCRVIALDLIPERMALAEKLAQAVPLDPAADAVAQVMRITNGIGADKVLLCAATRSSDPTNLAFRLCRERGRVVMVGAMGMELERTEFYNRELDFVISRSSGPGRYDRRYEQRGVDYPVGYVRWTEQRNMEAFLQLIASGRLDVAPLATAEFPVEQASAAYQLVKAGSLGVILSYGVTKSASEAESINVLRRPVEPVTGTIGLALVGAGSFARGTHLPNIRASRTFTLRAVVSGGASASQIAASEGAALATTDLKVALDDPTVQAVLIATRHHLHADEAVAAARAGKHIFVEKPLALTIADCQRMVDAASEAGVLLTVGFNRRLAPAAIALRAALERVSGPRTAIFRVNAGVIPPKHWLNDPEEGGGRLLGEGVHFIDFLCGLVGHPPLLVSAQGTPDGQESVITLRFPDDSLGVVLYTARGDVTFPKERIEVFAGKGVAVLDDFRTLAFSGMPGKAHKGAPDKGHRALLENFGAAIRGEAPLAISGLDGLRATAVALAALESIQTGRAVPLSLPPEN